MLARAIARRRVGADPQHGDRRRQHPAAHALHLLLRRRRLALQQAQPGPGLRRDRRLQPHPRDPRRLAGLRRDASVRHVRGAGRARRRRALRGRRRRAHAAARPTCTACPATSPKSRPMLRAGRADHRRRAAAAAVRARARPIARCATASSYAFALVSVAAALELDGGDGQGRAASRSAASRTSRGARGRPKRRCEGKPATTESFPRRGRGGAGRRRSRCATTHSRSSSPSARSPRCSAN